VVSPSGGTQRHPGLGLFLMLCQMLLFRWLEFKRLSKTPDNAAIVQRVHGPRQYKTGVLRGHLGSSAAIYSLLGIFEPFFSSSSYTYDGRTQPLV